MAVLVTVEAVAIVLLAVLVAGLLRSHGEILRALHDLGVNLDPAGASQPAPLLPSPTRRAGPAATDLTGVTLRQEAIAVGVTGPGQWTLLAFLSSGCVTCGDFWRAFGAPGDLGLPEDVRLVAVTKGPEHESESRLAELAPPGLTVVLSSDAWTDYEVQVAPYFVLVESGRVVGEGAARAWPQVQSLLSQALADRDAGRWQRPRPPTDLDSEDAVDRELLAAGIRPGDPRLHHPPAAGGGR